METLINKQGCGVGKTATVEELKAALEKYPSEMPVIATWEGIYSFIDADLFEVGEWYIGSEADREKCLVIDVDKY